MMEKEARTNKAGADLDRRNRNWQKIDTHLAETVSQMLPVARDMSLAGTQRISTPKRPKTILITASVNGTKKQSTGMWSENGNQRALAILENGVTMNFSTPARCVALGENTSNYYYAEISNITNDGFDLVWNKQGAVNGNGTAVLFIQVGFHGEG